MVITFRNEICAMHKCVTFIHKGRCPTHSRQRGFRGPPAGATGKLFDFAQHLPGCGPRYCVICGARMEVAALDEAAAARDKCVHSRQKRPQIGGRVPKRYQVPDHTACADRHGGASGKLSDRQPRTGGRGAAAGSRAHADSIGEKPFDLFAGRASRRCFCRSAGSVTSERPSRLFQIPTPCGSDLQAHAQCTSVGRLGRGWR